jgi:mono/diheme cytochrome c family protein
MTIQPASRFLLVLVAFCFSPGCQQQMAKQPSYRPDEPSAFFPDGRAARPVVPGTVARGHLKTDTHLFTGSRFGEGIGPAQSAALVGAAGGSLLGLAASLAMGAEDHATRVFPFPITAQVLQHGRDRYQIYCAVCHDELGTGHGMIVERGYTPPPSYHIERLRVSPVGHFFEVVTRGYGSMPSYKRQIPARDRWAIIAYIRALQLSQRFPVQDLPEPMRQEWAKQAALAAAGGEP